MIDRKPILCLDFDGVIHSYTSGWKGADVVPDPPVPGALEFIVEALEHFTVAIFSSRSNERGGIRAMQHWLGKNLVDLAPTWEETPDWLQRRIGKTAFAEPWEDEVEWAAGRVITDICWPKEKPPALVTIDDRAICFTGEWPSMGAIKSFKPWNKP